MEISFIIRKLNTLFELNGQPSVAGYLFLALTFLSFNASAAIISVDDIGGFGIDSLTRDTDQGLDFLDVTLSTGRSFNDVSGELGIGGDFEGFRYATIDEVIELAINFGIDPTFEPGDFGDPGIDISGLVDLLGVNSPIGPFNRKTTAMTSTVGSLPGLRRQVEFLDEFDNTIFDDRISSEVAFSTGVETVHSTKGSYLVRAQPVPEPATMLLVLIGAASVFGMRQRRKRIE